MKIYPVRRSFANNRVCFGRVSKPAQNSVEANFRLKENSKGYFGENFGEQYNLKCEIKKGMPTAIIGNIGEKIVNIKIEDDSAMTGTVGDKQVNLNLHFNKNKWLYKIDGNFGNQTVMAEIDNSSCGVYGDKYIHGNDINIHNCCNFRTMAFYPSRKFYGEYDLDKDFLPILGVLVSKIG